MTTSSALDDVFMRDALEQARRGEAVGEVPVGAVVVVAARSWGEHTTRR